MNLSIDRSSPIPLYHQVVQGIEAAITSGALAPGHRLEGEIDLAAALNVSRPTMRKAMDVLVRAGLLLRKRGVGTQVVSSRVRRPLELSSLFDDLAAQGSNPSIDIHTFSHAEAIPEVCAKLDLATGSKVYYFTRRHKVDGKPLAPMENWVRDDIVNINEAALGAQGL